MHKLAAAVVAISSLPGCSGGPAPEPIRTPTPTTSTAAPTVTAAPATGARPTHSAPPSTTPRPTPTSPNTSIPTVTTAPITPTATSSKGNGWRPHAGLTWHIQYAGKLDLTRKVGAYNIDGADTPAATVAALRQRGVAPVCYFSAGSFEDWRDDKHRFPKNVLGKPLGEWKGERWLDIRQLDTLMPIMKDRMRACKDKGFVAVDPDNVDGASNPTGFPLTRADQDRYLKALSTQAHELGLAIGLKNALESIPTVVGWFDFAVNEQCHQYRECDAYAPFIKARKPVLNIEYGTTAACKNVPAGLHRQIKNKDLDARTHICRG